MSKSNKMQSKKDASKKKDVSTPGAGKKVSKKDEEKPGGFKETMRTLAIAAVLFIIIRTFLIQTFVITSGSMENTLLVGDFLLVNRVATGARIPFTQAHIPGYTTPKRGDVLVFDPHHEPDLKLVKRLIGLPGDTVQSQGGVVTINGQPLDEPYLVPPTTAPEFVMQMGWQGEFLPDNLDPADYRPDRDTWGPLVVPADHYFMLGDNRGNSQDSRYWGFLESWRIEGRVSFIYYSYERRSTRPFAFIRDARWGRIGDGVE